MDKENTYDIIFPEGRFCNQLYFCLYCMIHKCHYKCISLNKSDWKLKKYLDYFDLYNQYYDDNIDDKKTTSKYMQKFGSDFTEHDLNQFCKKLLYYLKIEENIKIYKDIDFDNVYCFHIRNTDYINNSFADIFNRELYYEKVFNKIGKQNIIYVISDDINYCKDKYESLFKKFCINIKYNCIETLYDFRLLCSFKKKVILNSTYGAWSAYISNVFYSDSYKDIYAPNTYKLYRSNLAINNPKWNLIDID